MNINPTNVISDILGKSEQAIIFTIIESKRDPKKLSALTDPLITNQVLVRLKRFPGRFRGLRAKNFKSILCTIKAKDIQLNPEEMRIFQVNFLYD